MTSRICSILFAVSFAVTLYGQTARQIELLKQYADKGSAACSYRLAEFARAGKLSKDKKVNQEAYNRYFNKALNAGFPKARLELAVRYLNGRLARNQQLAYDILNGLLNVPVSRDFTKENLFETYYWMGYCLERGKGCTIDTSSAYFYYRLSSIVNLKARFVILWHLGKEKDKNVALEYLYKICCDDSSAETMANVRSFLSNYNLVDAFAVFLEKKAKVGDGKAGKILAENQWAGDLFARNLTFALRNYEQAAKYGDTHSALKLAEIYSKIDLGYVKGLRKINLYENLNHISRDLQKAESFAKKALFHKDTRNDAALMMIQLVKLKLQRFKNPPAGASTFDSSRVSKSGPPLPPVPGKVIPAGRLNKMAQSPVAQYCQLRNELFYYLMLLEDYPAARKVLEADGSNEFHAKYLYLKAKEFKKAHGAYTAETRKQYHDRVRMAANAGYPLAIYEFFLGAEFANERTVNYSKLIEAALQMPYPEQSQWHWKLGQWFMQPGADRNPAQALACIRQAADMGDPDALHYLMESYRRGNATLNIPRNNAQAEKFRKLLLKHDIRMTKPAVFADYLKKLKPDQNIKTEDYNILFRAIGHSPLAMYKYAQMRFTGNKSLKIEKNAEHALNLLHLAVSGDMTKQAVAEILKQYPGLIDSADISKFMHYEQKMIPLYKKIQ